MPDPAGPARPRRHPLRRAARPGLAPRRRVDRRPGATASSTVGPDRGLAAAGARPRAGRPDPDLEPVDARAAGRLLRRDARAAGPRPARPADVGRRGRDDRAGPSGARHLILGTGRDAPDPREAGLADFPTTTRRGAVRRAGRRRSGLPARLGGAPGRLGPPDRRRGLRARLHQRHDRHAEGRDADPRQRRRHRSSRSTGSSRRWTTGSSRCCRCRTCSSRRSGCTTRSTSGPTSCTSAAGTRGSSSMRCATTGSRAWSSSPRCSTCSGAPSSARSTKRGRRGAFERLRGIARRLPFAVRRLLFRQRPRAARRALPAVPVVGRVPAAGAPAGAGRTSASPSSRATARPRPGPGTCTTLDDHGPGTVGRGRRRASRCGSPGDGEIQFRGRTVFGGYWNAPELTAQAFTEDGWYRTGDLGRFDDAGRLILSGRIKDIIVLPNGFNVYPEDIENALRIAGLRDAVVVETEPGRIEAVVLADSDGGGAGRDPGARRCRGQGGERDPRAEPADRRLAAVAGRGLPADAHAQDQARPDPALGVGATRRLPVSDDPGATGVAAADQAGTGTPVPSVSRAAWMSGWRGSSAPPPGPTSRARPSSPTLADDVARAERRSGPGPGRSPGRPPAPAAAVGRRRSVGRTRRRR